MWWFRFSTCNYYFFFTLNFDGLIFHSPNVFITLSQSIICNNNEKLFIVLFIREQVKHRTIISIPTRPTNNEPNISFSIAELFTAVRFHTHLIHRFDSLFQREADNPLRCQFNFPKPTLWCFVCLRKKRSR